MSAGLLPCPSISTEVTQYIRVYSVMAVLKKKLETRHASTRLSFPPLWDGAEDTLDYMARLSFKKGGGIKEEGDKKKEEEERKRDLNIEVHIREEDCLIVL